MAPCFQVDAGITFEDQLRERLQKVEALCQGAATAGERQASASLGMFCGIGV